MDQSDHSICYNCDLIVGYSPGTAPLLILVLLFATNMHLTSHSIHGLCIIILLWITFPFCHTKSDSQQASEFQLGNIIVVADTSIYSTRYMHKCTQQTSNQLHTSKLCCKKEH